MPVSTSHANPQVISAVDINALAALANANETAVAGKLASNDASVTNSRAPNGAAGGGLGGSFPNPTVNAIATPGGLSATGVAGVTTFLRGDGSWQVPAGGGGGGQTVRTVRFTTTAVASDYVLADTTSRSVTDGTTTNTSTTVGSATAAFVAGDVGRGITGTGIPAASTIVSVTSGTAVVISAAATATGSALTLIIGGNFTVTIPVLTASQRVSVKNIGTGTVTITPTAGTIDGATSLVLSAQSLARDIVGDGTNLWVA